MINEIQMDILNAPGGIIVHQVNCVGVMGAGLALQIRKRWPDVYGKYRKSKISLGQIQVIRVQEKPLLFVCNLAGQEQYGRDQRYTDYGAVWMGLNKLNEWAREKAIRDVYIPYKMGCSLGGGEWIIVRRIIEEIFVDRDVRICRLTEKGGDKKCVI